MTTLEQYIQSYFGIIQLQHLTTVSAYFKPVSLQKGDYFQQSGKRCTQLAFVQSGLLRIFAETDDREVTQWISTQGYFVTDLTGFMFDQPGRWHIQALTDTALHVIEKVDYRQLASRIPEWRAFEQIFMAKCFIMMEDRIFNLLSMSAAERYQLFFEHNPELFNEVPLQYIASMLGMTPETFSRIRKKRTG
jgi:CRP/FNR family transcriptional regulator, anaerobic regulatory protein